MAKIGRNDRCSCGSGKKYKHCCYGKEAGPPTHDDAWLEDPEWHKVRLTEATAESGILDFGFEKYGDDFLTEALAEFTLWGEFEINDAHIESIFAPWVAFTWMPETDEPVLLGLDYLGEKAARLDDYQQRFIWMACTQPFSFFVVTTVVAGKSLGLRDIFLERAFTVKEAKASKTLRRGDIIFAKVVLLDGEAILVGMGPIGIPPSEHTRLLDVRDQLKQEMRDEGFEMNLQSLVEWDLEMRAAYLSAAEFLTNPPRPELQNTDGDPISFVKLYFDLGCSAEEAFAGLRSLALYQDGITEDATRDENGDLLEVSFDWLRKGNKKHKSWENTILGRLTIKGNTVTAEVNSEKRAKRIQAEVTKRLGKRATFKRSVHESVDAKLEEIEAQSVTPEFEEARREQEEFASRPEVQAIVKAQMEAHWEGWYNEHIPALQNKTPLEAARTKQGRERLEALLLDFERRNENVPHPALRVDVAAMRKKLGL